jgi:Flp pilus assembly protein TadG
MIRRSGVGIAALVFVATAGVATMSAGPAAAAGKLCPTFSKSGTTYTWETAGTGYTCASAKTWILKLIKDPVDTSTAKAVLTNGPSGLHCYATGDDKGKASAGVCYKNTIAFPKSGFLWSGS